MPVATTALKRLASLVLSTWQGFRSDSFVSSGDRSSTSQTGGFSSFQARGQRYRYFWSMYENSVYSNLISSAPDFIKEDLGLYRFIRGVYNPSYRLGEFYATHTLGGAIDPDAGDGQDIPSAIPIVTDIEALRPAIARLFRDSNMQTAKSIWTRYGAIMGDAPLKVIDDPIKGKVTLLPIDPRKLADYQTDQYGNVKAYTLCEWRDDPEDENKVVVYTETAERGIGEEVIYRTYKGDGSLRQPYGWDGNPPEWTVPYGFIPMVIVQHINVGLGAGWSELHADWRKIHELDDQASLLDDFVRQNIKAPHFVAGAKAPKSEVKYGSSRGPGIEGPVEAYSREVAGSSQTERDQMDFLWSSNPQARPFPLVSSMSIGDARANIELLIKQLESDFPELGFDRLRTSGEMSGEAFRVARRPVEAKMLQRRASYDYPLTRAIQMGIAIGGYRGYDEYQGFGLESYNAGAMDFRIGSRPVFDLDESDRIDEEQRRGAALESMTRAGVPLDLSMKRLGFSQDEIAQAVKEKEDAQKLAMDIAQQAGSNDPSNSNDNPSSQGDQTKANVA